jgi:hypothetical protein
MSVMIQTPVRKGHYYFNETSEGSAEPTGARSDGLDADTRPLGIMLHIIIDEQWNCVEEYSFFTHTGFNIPLINYRSRSALGQMAWMLIPNPQACC